MKNQIENRKREIEKKKKDILQMNSSEKMSLFEEFAENRIFLDYEVFEFLFFLVFSPDENFISLLCKIIEGGKFILSKHKDFIKSKSEDTLKIINKMFELCEVPDLSAGITISPLVGTKQTNCVLLKEIKSGEQKKQRFVLYALIYAIKFEEWININEIFTQIREIYVELKIKEHYVYMQLLVEVMYVDKELVLDEIIKEISENTEISALSFVKASLYRKFIGESLFKDAIQILEAEKNQIVDKALCRVYLFDNLFVVNILEKRILNGKYNKIISLDLKKIISSNNPFPVVKMLEKHLNINGFINGHSIQFLFGDLLNSDQWIEWCEKNKNIEQLERVILISLSKILSDLINFEPNKIRDKAISLVKEFSRKKSIDFEDFTRKINLGKDKRDKDKIKEKNIRALYVIKELLFPIRRINISVLKENLEKYQYISKIFGLNWILKNAESKNPHQICFIFDRKIDQNYLDELENSISIEKDSLRKALMINELKYHISIDREQNYWNEVFRNLSEHNLNFRKSKLHNSEESEGLLVEAEIWSLISKKFKTEHEPDTRDLYPKKLDFLVELDQQNILLETKFVGELIEHSLNVNPLMSRPGEKIFSVLCSTFQNQLFCGKRDAKKPMVIILCMHPSFNYFDAENAILGEFVLVFEKYEEHIGSEHLRRNPNGFFFEDNSDIISAIITYRRDFTSKDTIKGRIYLPPKQVKTKYPLSEKSCKKLTSSLFGSDNKQA